MSETKDPREPNQGEGDRASARRYDQHVEEYVAEGKVDPAAKTAESYVEAHPDDARAAERDAKRGPHGGAFAELIERSRAMIRRVRERMSHRQ